MPSINKGPLAAFGTFRNFAGVIREISFDDEREQAETMPRFLVIAETATAGEHVGRVLTGQENSAAVTVWTLDEADQRTDAYDVVVVNSPKLNAMFKQVRDKAGNDGPKVFDLSRATTDDESWAKGLRVRIACSVPDLAPAFGRWFPVFRPAATKAVIDQTARVNAQFALVSNIPAAIPIVGALAAVGADFVVLTKNQVMMVFKLAAINGRDLTDQWKIIREMIPVVGAGFMWRTLARQAATFVPLMAGTVPKVAIAYTGTVAVGRGADFYYRVGEKPSKEQVRLFYEQAAESLKRLPIPLGRDNGSVQDNSESQTEISSSQSDGQGNEREQLTAG